MCHYIPAFSCSYRPIIIKIHDVFHAQLCDYRACSRHFISVWSTKDVTMGSLNVVFPARSVQKCYKQIWRSVPGLSTSEAAFRDDFTPLKTEQNHSHQIKENGERIDLMPSNICPECHTQYLPLLSNDALSKWHVLKL